MAVIFWRLVCWTPGCILALCAEIKRRNSIQIAVGTCHGVSGSVGDGGVRRLGVMVGKAHEAFSLERCDGLPWTVLVTGKVLGQVLPRCELASVFFPTLPS